MSTAATTFNIDGIPAELRNGRAFWVPWRYEAKPGKKPTKILKQWNQPGNASSTAPRTWTVFDNAVQSATARGYDGIGIVVSNDDPYSVVDLDNCIDEAGAVSDEAQKIVEQFNSYTEITPSGKGLRIVAKGKFEGKGKKVEGVELYCRERFVSITGNHLAGTPTTVNENKAAVDWLYAKLRAAKPKPATTGPTPDVSGFDQNQLAERCWRYVSKCPDAISGDGGHNATFRAACECFRFGLDDEHAAEVMRRFNEQKTGGEQWDDDELQHKLESAKEEVAESGEFGSRLASDVLDRKAPLAIARKIIAECFTHPECPTLVFSGEDFHHFSGVHWHVIERPAVRQRIYQYLEPRKVSVTRGDATEIVPFHPTARDVDGVIDAMKAAAYSPVKPPAWISGEGMPAPSELIVAPNGIFRLCGDGAEKLCDPTPRLFSVNALDYPFHLTAPPPRRWLEFLNDIFDGDQQQIDLLQEWCGYVLTPDTRLQKMLLLIGPPRSGKGTIARVMTRVVGAANVVAPTLAGLGTNFGLWPLVGKTLAIVSDARLSGRTDQAIVVERLLSISGEDSLTIDQKHRELITTKLTTRIMLLSNELPRLADASGALASRFVILSLRKSYLGAEDTGLTERLIGEAPNIAAWSLEGLRRLRDEYRFTDPATGDDLRQELNDLASPIRAFLRECCNVQSGQVVEVSDLYAAWGAWCVEQARQPGPVNVFGRDLRAAVPGLRSRQPREGDSRKRVYEGISLKLAAAEAGRIWKNRASQERNGTHADPLHARRAGAREEAYTP